MSPDPSLKDRMSDSVEDDEDMDEYEIFATPGQRNLRQQQQHSQQHSNPQHQQYIQYQFYQQQQQQQQQQQYNYEEAIEKPITPLQILRPYHPMVLQRTLSMPQFSALNALYQHSQQNQLSMQQVSVPELQFQLQLEPQQQQHLQPQELEQQPQISLPQYTRNPSYTIPGADRFVPFPESFSDFTALEDYLSALQLQRPVIQSTIPTLEQDMDLMMLSALTLSGLDDSDLLHQLNTSTASSVQSPSLSWASASPSREGSPSSSQNIFRPHGSLSPSSPLVTSSIASKLSNSTSTATTELASSSSTSAAIPSSTATSSSSAPKPRRRVRPPTIKKPKKVKPTSFPCTAPGCDKVFSRAYNLTSHMKTHSSERPFLCGVCSLAFARRHDRERHVRLHTGEKPYSCEICGVGFMRNDALLRHQKFCGTAGSSFATDIHDDLE
ncbi:hypothetical protein EDD21DRAFT_385455 [Dissophora ornata]|nr:hypothetical protein EDD21DRAFT_385455 [Dissophora ornata]